ncbi:MAG: DUF2530 domain-containing protein [Actinomycetota bacterium]|nr:DUF2530 domain-containing protein [Actinomycetota bacterium]
MAAGGLLVSDGPVQWIWACLTGGLLGIIGLGMIYWQRRAAQQGSRSAQQGLL